MQHKCLILLYIMLNGLLMDIIKHEDMDQGDDFFSSGGIKAGMRIMCMNTQLSFRRNDTYQHPLLTEDLLFSEINMYMTSLPAGQLSDLYEDYKFCRGQHNNLELKLDYSVKRVAETSGMESFHIVASKEYYRSGKLKER